MKKFFPAFLTLFIFLQSLGCKEDKEKDPYDFRAIYECHRQKSQSEDSLKIALVGKWTWAYMTCCGETVKPSESSTKNLGTKIEFKEGGTGTLNSPDTIAGFTWDIIQHTDKLEIEINPYLYPLYGRPVVCDKLMLFNGSIVDGEDNFFRKE